jgi:hypothetical protein
MKIITEAVLRAADLDASCLRGALPVIRRSLEGEMVGEYEASVHTSGGFAGSLLGAGHRVRAGRC